MLLRRITKHVKAQNWFAVGIDFVIVVVGIWVALLVGQWTEDRQKHINLERAKLDINNEILSVYYYAYERLAVAPCRKARYSELGELLLNTDTQWPGSSYPYGDGILTKHRVFPPALRSPSRPWSSLVWETELNNGTLETLDTEEKRLLSFYYETVIQTASLQQEVYKIESRLQALSYPLDMTTSDRLRYYDILSEADAQSALLELNAEQMIQMIEENNLAVFKDQDRIFMEEFLKQRNASRGDVYGDCTEVISLPLLSNNQTDRSTN